MIEIGTQPDEALASKGSVAATVVSHQLDEDMAVRSEIGR